MGIMYRVCDCEDWKQGMTQIDGFIMLGLATRGYTYRGKQFVYCPWCGSQIRDADITNEPPPEEEAVVVKTDGATDNTRYTSTVRESG